MDTQIDHSDRTPHLPAKNDRIDSEYESGRDHALYGRSDKHDVLGPLRHNSRVSSRLSLILHGQNIRSVKHTIEEMNPSYQSGKVGSSEKTVFSDIGLHVNDDIIYLTSLVRWVHPRRRSSQIYVYR